jgi:hypothetical protein
VVVGHWLWVGYIESRSPDRIGAKRIKQGIVIKEWAARDIDENRV